MKKKKRPVSRKIIRKKISPEYWGIYQLTRNDKAPIKPHHPSPIEPYHEWDFKPYEHEPVICEFFGCPKVLSLQEQMAGRFCISHQTEKSRTTTN